MKTTLKSRVSWSVFLVILLLYSCKDSFLEVPVSGQLDSKLLSGKLGLDAAIIAAYSQVNGRANRMASPSNWVWGSIRGGEANKGTDPGDFSDINPIQTYAALPNQGVISDKWNGNYEGVARANAVLKLMKTADPAVTADQLKNIGAQAKFLRGHFYFELKRGFNNTPYVDENIDVAADASIGVEAGIGQVKNDKELWPMIEADMKFAADNLPETQAEVGRVNSWAAKAYLAKIYMYQKKFTEAKALYDEIIAKGKTTN